MRGPRLGAWAAPGALPICLAAYRAPPHGRMAIATVCACSAPGRSAVESRATTLQSTAEFATRSGYTTELLVGEQPTSSNTEALTAPGARYFTADVPSRSPISK